MKTKNPYEQTLISIEELKQIPLREIHTCHGCEDVSAVGIYPVTDEAESNRSLQVVSGEGVDPKPQTALRFTPSTSFVANTIC